MVGPRLEAGPLGVHLEAFEVADDEQGRLAQRLVIVEELLVGRAQVLALALVLPAEVVLEPHVGEAVARARALRAFLEGVEVAGGVGLVGAGLVNKRAEIEEVVLRGSAFAALRGDPLARECGGVHEAILAQAPLQAAGSLQAASANDVVARKLDGGVIGS